MRAGVGHRKSYKCAAVSYPKVLVSAAFSYYLKLLVYAAFSY